MAPLRYVLLGVAACVLAVIGWRLIHAGQHTVVVGTVPSARIEVPSSLTTAPFPFPTEADKLATARRAIEKRLGEVPRYAVFFTKLEAAFPQVYGKLLDRWAGKDGAEATAAPSSPDDLLLQAARALQQSRGVLARRAGQDALRNYFDARSALLDALAPDNPGLCADFLYGSVDAPLTEFAAAHQDLAADLALGLLDAVASGEVLQGSAETPTTGDMDLVASGLAARGLSAAEVDLLLDGTPMDPAPPDGRICEMGRIYLSVLRALPDDARRRVYSLAAELLARS